MEAKELVEDTTDEALITNENSLVLKAWMNREKGCKLLWIHKIRRFMYAKVDLYGPSLSTFSNNDFSLLIAIELINLKNNEISLLSCNS
jgi:hypothetical protein